MQAPGTVAGGEDAVLVWTDRRGRLGGHLDRNIELVGGVRCGGEEFSPCLVTRSPLEVTPQEGHREKQVCG